MGYSASTRMCLLQVALDSIESGLHTGTPKTLNSKEYGQQLREHRACFITLKKAASLRGCIGSLEARRQLVEDVSDNAFAAATRDPRFQPLRSVELDSTDIGISVLGPSEPLAFDSQQALIGMLRPGLDGLILQDRDARGTFLPSVWESLPEPAAFLDQLKVKAGLSADYWSDSIRVWRYTTESFSAPAREIKRSNETSIRSG